MRGIISHPVFLVAVLALGTGGQPVGALPKPDEPIDPTKRAPISTANAVQPSATRIEGNGVVGGRIIRMSEIPIQHAAIEDQRAAVDVRETRKKDKVIKPSAKEITARSVEIRRASDRPAAIPRIDAEQFRHMLRAYEDNRVPAAELASGDIKVGKKRVTLADINRFADPRATLEAQGIPVTVAGSQDKAERNSAPVPISQEKNGGDLKHAAAANAASAPPPSSP